MEHTTSETVAVGGVGESGKVGGDQSTTTATTSKNKNNNHSKGVMKKVVVAVDESQGSLYALSWALDHLFHMSAGTSSESQSELVLVHAQQPLHPYMYPVGPAVYATTSLAESVKQAQEENSRHVLNKALQVCLDRGVRAETVVAEGDPKEMICQTAEQTHADLLIVGSRGLGTFKRAFLGSVSDYCAHHARCPVLIVKPLKSHPHPH